MFDPVFDLRLVTLKIIGLQLFGLYCSIFCTKVLYW